MSPAGSRSSAGGGEATPFRLRLDIQGAVQGVGFRPFVSRLAAELALAGWVRNTSHGVTVEVEGASETLDLFRRRLEAEIPPQAFILAVDSARLEPVGHDGFEIRPSRVAAGATALVLPDLATCGDCRRELFDPRDRRHRYPFINCTRCGPRFSIIEALPYDRPRTTMKRFTLCEECRREYEDPADRRFHAQPNACPRCGPRVQLWDAGGGVLAADHAAIQETARAVAEGRTVAVKGLGGFHLVADARDDDAVRRLRERKQREAKPLAVMMPDLDAVTAECDVSPQEERLLLSVAAPIVLLDRRRGASSEIAPSVAPGNPTLGVMLPYTPLHLLLLDELAFPVVATSGNRSDEPICIDEHDARDRLGEIADLFLVHDRPILRHVDDSIARVLEGREQILRRARGYAPLPFLLPRPVAPTLAVGAHLKSCVALAVGEQAFVSQHIGDLDTERSQVAFGEVTAALESFHEVEPERVLCDAHPDYPSTRYAHGRGRPVTAIQHHVAHVFAGMLDNELSPPVLGVAWDGTGYGDDGTVWGGEFFLVEEGGCRRIARLRRFSLPGGEQAIREPRRSALGLLYELAGAGLGRERYGDDLPSLGAFTVTELDVLSRMLESEINTPRTSSAGRLFDAVASLLGVRQKHRFEGEAAMELEFACAGPNADDPDEGFPFGLEETRDHEGEPLLVLDWGPTIEGILSERRQGASLPRMAARFHETLASMVVAVARESVLYDGELNDVVLTGGCFLNRVLSRRAVAKLRRDGFRPHWHQRIPPGDGGIALGQLEAALRGGVI